MLNMGLMFMASIPVMMIGGIFMALREDLGLSWLVAVAVPLLGVIVGSIVVRMLPWFRKMGFGRRGQPDPARADHRHPSRVPSSASRSREARFDGANTTYTGTALAVGKLFRPRLPLVMLVFNRPPSPCCGSALTESTRARCRSAP